jgi:hypothetical protein
MAHVLAGILGLIMTFAGIRELGLTLRQSTFRLRGGRRLRRKSHLVIFCANVAGIGIFSLLGLSMMCWALLGLR